MKKYSIALASLLLVFSFTGCKNTTKKTSHSTEDTSAENQSAKTVYASNVIPFFDDWKLILGDGSNVGIANDFENKDFFYTENENGEEWVVFKAPNGGDTRHL